VETNCVAKQNKIDSGQLFADHNESPEFSKFDVHRNNILTRMNTVFIYLFICQNKICEL
jgi:hypothetical protein